MNRLFQKIKNGYDRVNHYYKCGYNAIFYSCEQMMKLSSTSMEKRLSWRERFTRKIHFFLCTWCRRYEKQLGFLRKNIARYGEEIPEHGTEDLSSEARARIRKRLQEKNREGL